jgi:hypothetical protein
MILPHESALTSNTRSNLKKGGVYGFFFDPAGFGALSGFGLFRLKLATPASIFDGAGIALLYTRFALSQKQRAG